MSLSPNQVSFFHEKGYLIVENLLTFGEVNALRQRAEEIARGALPEGTALTRQVEPDVASGEKSADDYELSLRKMTRLAVSDAVFRAHACNAKIVECIAALLGQNLKLYQDQLFMKPPRVGSRQKYHQDQPLGFYLDPPQLVTCWAAMDDSTLANGCLRVIPGTHKCGEIPREKWQEYERRAIEGRLTEEVPLVMKAGDCSFHHGFLLHASEVNRSDQRRRGYATHYVPAEVRYVGPEPRPEFLLVRGQSFEGRI
jgi:ectoine hydroxylase-related dioxygenase (phytanoyl-CoA dioxygenase family)